MTLIFKIILIIATCLLALIAGLFYSYSCSVNLGLGRLSGTEYLKAMQSINRAILNSWFFASFFGSMIMMSISTWLSYRLTGADLSFYLLLTATIVYLFGVFGVTVLGNVPLNESLDKFDITQATPEEIKIKRTMFEVPWNRFNLIRTIANLTSFLLFIGGIIRKY